jgi:hypothetical protein
LAVHELDVTSLGPGGAMGALRSGDERALDKVLLQLGHVGWAALDWGEGDTDGSDASAPDAWSRILAEGEALWPLMEPGKVMTADGRSWSGVSPSGARRGDRFITAFDERLSDDAGSWCALRSLHEKLRAFGFALGARMRSIRLTHSGDTLFACFPGNGALYGPHYDGGPHDSRKLTMILYVNADWRAEDGGALMILRSCLFEQIVHKCVATCTSEYFITSHKHQAKPIPIGRSELPTKVCRRVQFHPLKFQRMTATHKCCRGRPARRPRTDHHGRRTHRWSSVAAA